MKAISNNKYNLRVKPCHGISGEISVSGFKHAAVPIIASSILSTEKVIIENLPQLYEIKVLERCLNYLGCRTLINKHIMEIDSSNFFFSRLPHSFIKAVHGSLYLLPSILIRNKFIDIYKDFGGCDLGGRPIENVIYPLRKIGANIRIVGDRVIGTLGQAKGAKIDLRFFKTNFNQYVSGATKSALIASTLAEGDTEIINFFPREPTKHLCEFLNACGGDIHFSEREIFIRGVNKLKGGRYILPSDQIEIFTYICLVGVCKGKILLKNARIEDSFYYETNVFRENGILIDEDKTKNEIKVSCTNDIKGIDVNTAKFHTDIQPLYTVLMTSAKKKTTVAESVWKERFQFVPELQKMGAKIKKKENSVATEYTSKLEGGTVEGKDLRGTACLILAALKSKRETRILNAQHLERGYENILEKLRDLNIDIRKE